MINFNHLRIFYETARYMSCTKAAKNLFITQPAVTAQLKIFEKFCGFKLFKKRGRRIHLTDEGRVLFDLAKKVFEFEREIENTIEELQKLKRGLLRIGTTKTYARFFMPYIVQNFRCRYPGIKIFLNEGSSKDILLSLLDLKNEIGIIAMVENYPDIEVIPFAHEELILILPPGHPLTKEKEVSIEELMDYPLIMKEEGSGTRKIVDRLFSEKGITPNILMETSNTEFIKQLVKQGNGISFVVKDAVYKELKKGVLKSRPLEGKRLFLDISIAYLKTQPLSIAATRFLEMLKQMAQGLRPGYGIRELISYLDNNLPAVSIP